ncbi:MAG: DUF2029 domain-containing protein [Planctomycetes bacterium]|nr:DUF2029 domain-containing protein [Planctomycetota bacterium]
MSRKWVIILLTLLIALSLPRYVRTTILKPLQDDCPDFGVHYCSARVLGTGLDFYDTPKLKVQAARFGVVMELDGTNHPPFLATLLWPLSWVPYDAAKALWVILNQVLLAGVIALLSAWTGRAQRFAVTAALVVIALNSGPVAAHFAAGQVKLLVLFLLCASLVLFDRRRDEAAGILVGLAAAIQLYPAAFSLYFAWKRAWRAFAASVVASALATVLTLSVLGWRIHANYITDVLPHAAVQRDLDHFSNQSIYALCLRVFSDTRFSKALVSRPELARPSAALLSLMALSAAAYVCRRRERPSGHALKLEASFVLLTANLAVSHAWDMSFVVTFLPLAVALAQLLSAPGMTGWGMATWLLAAVLIHFDFGWLLSARANAATMVCCPRLLGSLFLLALVALLMRSTITLDSQATGHRIDRRRESVTSVGT